MFWERELKTDHQLPTMIKCYLYGLKSFIFLSSICLLLTSCVHKTLSGLMGKKQKSRVDRYTQCRQINNVITGCHCQDTHNNRRGIHPQTLKLHPSEGYHGIGGSTGHLQRAPPKGSDSFVLT